MKLTLKEYCALYIAIYEREQRINYLIELNKSHDNKFNDEVIKPYNEELKTLEAIRKRMEL